MCLYGIVSTTCNCIIKLHLLFIFFFSLCQPIFTGYAKRCRPDGNQRTRSLYSCITRTRRRHRCWHLLREGWSRVISRSFDFRVACAFGCVRESRISHSALVTRVQLNMTGWVSITPAAPTTMVRFVCTHYAVRISSAHHIRTPIVRYYAAAKTPQVLVRISHDSKVRRNTCSW